MSAFVTDGELRSALAVTRALGRAGVPVTVGEAVQPSLAGSSRYCGRALAYPSPAHQPEGFLRFLCDAVGGAGPLVFFPMSDITTELLADAREELKPAVVPLPPVAQVRLARDKHQTLELARGLGIPCPVTSVPDQQRSIEQLAGSLEYPVVIKPRWSRHYVNGQWRSGMVEYAHDAQDLIAKYHAIDTYLPQALIQELVPGEGRGVFLLIWDGELKAAFSHRRLREKPPSGGISVLCESIPLDRELLHQSLTLLRALQWQGVAMVEYKLDARHNGSAKLMEVNGRFWGSLQLAIDAGVDFPVMLYQLAIGKKVAPQLTYRTGVKLRWLLGDLDHLWIRLKQRENGTPFKGPSRLATCLNFLKFYDKDMRYEVLQLDDPRPGWTEAKHYLRDLFLPREDKRAR